MSGMGEHPLISIGRLQAEAAMHRAKADALLRTLPPRRSKVRIFAECFGIALLTVAALAGLIVLVMV